MAFPVIATATAQVKTAAYQSTLQVPLFDPPYLLAEIPLLAGAAPLNPQSWWPCLESLQQSAGGAFIFLLATPFQYTKFQYRPANVTDRWNQLSATIWYANNLILPGSINSNTKALIKVLTAILGINTTFGSLPQVYNFISPNLLEYTPSQIFYNLQNFPSAAFIGAEVSSDAFSRGTTIFGNWDGTFPGNFTNNQGFKTELFHFNDLSPSILYGQPDFSTGSSDLTWLVMACTGTGNWRFPYAIRAHSFPAELALDPPVLYKIQFDDAALNAVFVPATFNPGLAGIGWAGNFSKGHIWIAKAADPATNQNQTVIVFNNDFTQYWRVKFLPQSQNSIDALNNVTNWSMKIDPMGVFYFGSGGTAGNTTNRQRLFNSKGLNFTFNFPTSNLAFGMLPCFQACYPFMTKNGGMI